jgi:hypothetical protein
MTAAEWNHGWRYGKSGSQDCCVVKITICFQIKYINPTPIWPVPCKTGHMLRLPRLLVVLIARCFCSRCDLVLENLALRHQLGVLKQKRPQTRLAASDRLFWVMLRRLWPGWRRALILVQPETVVCWHRAGFKSYWMWLSRHRSRPGRKCASKELRELILVWSPKTRPGVRRAFTVN